MQVQVLELKLKFSLSARLSGDFLCWVTCGLCGQISWCFPTNTCE